MKISLFTDASGDAVGWLGPFTGLLTDIVYEHVDYASGADVVVVVDSSGASVLSVTNIAASGRYPVLVQASNTGGTAIVGAHVPLRLEFDRLRVTVSSAGVNKLGLFSARVVA